MVSIIKNQLLKHLSRYVTTPIKNNHQRKIKKKKPFVQFHICVIIKFKAIWLYFRWCVL